MTAHTTYALACIYMALALVIMAFAGCGNQQDTVPGSSEGDAAEATIDQRSYDLGVIGAVAVGDGHLDLPGVGAPLADLLGEVHKADALGVQHAVPVAEVVHDTAAGRSGTPRAGPSGPARRG